MKVLDLNDVVTFVKESVARETKLTPDQVDVHQYLGVYGLDSINSVHVLVELEKFLQVELNPLVFWDYPTIMSLSKHLHQLYLNKR